METTKRPWAITNEGSAYMQGTSIVHENIEIAGVWEKEDAELIVRAVNTFDQAREALKLALGKLENLSKFSDEGGSFDQIREALAAMEATLCQPDK